MDKKKLLFTGDELISEILKQMPEAHHILLAHGLSCVGCHINNYETLKQGCAGHGYNDEEFNYLLTDLNDAAKELVIFNKKTQKKPWITQKAKEKILEFQKEQKKEGFGFKIEVSKTEGELSYFLNFLEKPETSDIIVESLNIKLFLSPESFRFLMGSEIDFIENNNGESGFKIDQK